MKRSGFGGGGTGSARRRRSRSSALAASRTSASRPPTSLQRLWENRYARCEIVVSRAVRRGELPPHTDARRLLIAATAPLYHQLLLLRTPSDPQLPGHAARTAALAAAAGAFAEAPSARDV
ncbi:TetR-like C-terminal domain-containing protein [Streptomyces rubiginosohelvolus]|uniref:TetR-like C-terminal domain-containing protein n=1 Tax=Streptomyces rubiginosohelvolus TaxID=67362 RepID=UPI00367DAA79